MKLPTYQDVQRGAFELRVRTFDQMTAEEIVAMHRARHAAFVAGAGWQLPSGRALLEVDGFDHDGAAYALGYAHGALVVSARLLTFADAMVPALWPAFAPLVNCRAGVEVSRLCAHGRAGRRFVAEIMSLYPVAVTAGSTARFAVADERIVRAYKLTMDNPPDCVDVCGEYPGLHLVQWS